MIENIFYGNREAVLRIVDLICKIAEISRIYDPEEVLYKLSYLVLVGIAEKLDGIDILAAFIVFEYCLDDLVDLFMHIIVAHM